MCEWVQTQRGDVGGCHGRRATGTVRAAAHHVLGGRRARVPGGASGGQAPRQRAWALALAWVWAWAERARPRATQPRPHGAGLVRVACPGVPRVRRTGQAWCGVRSGGGGGGVLEAGGENDEVPRRPAPAKQTELLGKPCLRAPLASNTERVAPTGSEQPTTFVHGADQRPSGEELPVPQRRAMPPGDTGGPLSWSRRRLPSGKTAPQPLGTPLPASPSAVKDSCGG